MKPRFEDIQELTEALKTGYKVNDRTTTANERLIFILLLVVLTKRSIPHVLNIRKNQFKTVRNKYIFRDVSPRAKNIYCIEFPMSFQAYLESYCIRYMIAPTALLFELNSEYVGNRFRELLKLQQKSFSINDIQKMIPYKYNTVKFNMQMERYILLFKVDEKPHYFTQSGIEMANMIEKFIKCYSDDEKLS